MSTIRCFPPIPSWFMIFILSCKSGTGISESYHAIMDPVRIISWVSRCCVLCDSYHRIMILCHPCHSEPMPSHRCRSAINSDGMARPPRYHITLSRRFPNIISWVSWTLGWVSWNPNIISCIMISMPPCMSSCYTHRVAILAVTYASARARRWQRHVLRPPEPRQGPLVHVRWRDGIAVCGSSTNDAEITGCGAIAGSPVARERGVYAHARAA